VFKKCRFVNIKPQLVRILYRLPESTNCPKGTKMARVYEGKPDDRQSAEAIPIHSLSAEVPRDHAGGVWRDQRCYAGRRHVYLLFICAMPSDRKYLMILLDELVHKGTLVVHVESGRRRFSLA